MARWTGTTTQRGYGWDHVQVLRTARQLWRPGQPCARCGQPIWVLHQYIPAKYILGQYIPARRVSVVDLGHTPDRQSYTGLEHMHCNRAEGARRGNRQRGQIRRAWKASASRQW